MSYFEETYRPQLEEAARYQDFITDELLKRGIVLNQYASREYQQKVGESASGIEIKYDKRMTETGNVYIEVAEKSNPSLPDYTESGVYRKDNTWLYLIGNYKKALLMSKRQLRVCIEYGEEWRKRAGIVYREIATSQGYTFPVAYCEKFLCLRLFEFNEEGGVSE